MNSTRPGEGTEARHFFDEDRQLTIGIHSDLWPLAEAAAQDKARAQNWLGGKGSVWEVLNIWVIGVVHRGRQSGLEGWEAVTEAVLDYLKSSVRLL